MEPLVESGSRWQLPRPKHNTRCPGSCPPTSSPSRPRSDSDITQRSLQLRHHSPSLLCAALCSFADRYTCGRAHAVCPLELPLPVDRGIWPGKIAASNGCLTYFPTRHIRSPFLLGNSPRCTSPRDLRNARAGIEMALPHRTMHAGDNL